MKTSHAILIMSAILLLCHTAESQTGWQQFTSGSQTYIRDINFTGALTGYAVGEGILRTTDAGRSWSTLYDEGPFYSAYFLSPDTGFLCVPGGYAERTTDGCLTWNNGTSVNSLQGLFFTSRDTGFAVGGMGILPGVIAKTSDQGSTWSYINIGPYGEFHSVYFPNPQLGFAAGGYNFTPLHQHPYYSGIIVRTTNRGEGWNTVFSESNFLYSVFFPSADIGYAAGDSGKVWKSVDAGSHWNLCTATGYTNKLFSVSFVTVDTGYVGGEKGLLLKTTDGGNSWITEDLSTTSDFCSMYLNPSGGALYLAGGNGNIFVRGNLPNGTRDNSAVKMPEVKAAPNPFTGSTTLTLHSNPGFACTFELYSPEGQILLEKKLYTDAMGTSSLKISDVTLPPGLILYRVIISDKVYTGKLIRF